MPERHQLAVCRGEERGSWGELRHGTAGWLVWAVEPSGLSGTRG